MQKILIAGGTGLIGSNLITKLKQKNCTIVLLSTQKDKADQQHIYYWNPDKNILPDEALKGTDICINLCGAGIFDKRFTAQRKKQLTDSRILPARLLYERFMANNIRPSQYIAGTATGFYENICSEKLTEDSTKGHGFISDLVQQWEAEAHRMQELCECVTVIRTGIVMSAKGGFLKQLALPVKWFVGAVPASGKQMISWIHIDDLTDMFIWCMEKQLYGTFNATASQPQTLQMLTKQVAAALHRPLWLPNIPVAVLKLIFGERYYLLLTSQMVSNEKIRQTGFKFRYEDSETAIKDLMKP